MFRVWVNIRFVPAEISRSMFECQEQTSSFQELGDANICLHVYESPKKQLGEFSLTQDTLMPGVPLPKTPTACLASCPPWEFLVLSAFSIPYISL